MARPTSPFGCGVSFAGVFLLVVVMTYPAMAEDKKSVVLELDHVSVCGSNLDTLRQAFTDVGMTPDLGGPHGNGVTQMAYVGFDDGTYIELIAPIKAGVTTGSEWAKYMFRLPVIASEKLCVRFTRPPCLLYPVLTMRPLSYFESSDA